MFVTIRLSVSILRGVGFAYTCRPTGENSVVHHALCFRMGGHVYRWRGGQKNYREELFLKKTGMSFIVKESSSNSPPHVSWGMAIPLSCSCFRSACDHPDRFRRALHLRMRMKSKTILSCHGNALHSVESRLAKWQWPKTNLSLGGPQQTTPSSSVLYAGIQLVGSIILHLYMIIKADKKCCWIEVYEENCWLLRIDEFIDVKCYGRQ